MESEMPIGASLKRFPKGPGGLGWRYSRENVVSEKSEMRRQLRNTRKGAGSRGAERSMGRYNQDGSFFLILWFKF